MADLTVVGTDGSDTAKLAVSEAVRLTKAVDGERHIVSAFEPLRGAHVAGAPEGAARMWAPHPDDKVEGILSEAAAQVRLAGLEAKTHAVRGHDPADAIVDVAREEGATMIVVGSQGMHG